MAEGKRLQPSPVTTPEMQPHMAAFYGDILSNMQFAKQQLWSTTNHTILIYAATFGLSRLRPTDWFWVLQLIVVVAAAAALGLLTTMQLHLHGYRQKIFAIETHYFSDDERALLALRRQPKPLSYDWPFFVPLALTIIAGAALTLLANTLPPGD